MRGRDEGLAAGICCVDAMVAGGLEVVGRMCRVGATDKLGEEKVMSDGHCGGYGRYRWTTLGQGEEMENRHTRYAGRHGPGVDHDGEMLSKSLEKKC